MKKMSELDLFTQWVYKRRWNATLHLNI